jgi:hypothetical protein
VTRRHATAAALASFLFFQTCLAGDAVVGAWSIRPTGKAGTVELSLRVEPGAYQMNDEREWATHELHGLDVTTGARHDVRFTIDRDAGTLALRGSLEAGEGGGAFEFSPSHQYEQELASLGITIGNEVEQLAMAVHDVSLPFVRELHALQLSQLTAGMLIAFRVQGVGPEFVRDLRAAGLAADDGGTLVALRVQHVTPDLVHAFHREGIQPDEGMLIALQTQGVTPEWIHQFTQMGYGPVPPGELVAFRIHGVSADLITKLRRLGYPNPAPGQLIAMRIHHVTPEYIASVQARGVTGLSLGELLARRIQESN